MALADSKSKMANNNKKSKEFPVKKAKKSREIGDANSPPSKKQKFSKNNDLFKQPTVEELNQLQETEALFHSNMFRLQIEELLPEVKVKEKYKKLFNVWFAQFKQSLTEKGSEVDDEKNQKEKSPQDTLTTPHSVAVIGSYSTDTMFGPNIVFDVMVEMPANSFKKADYENHKYMQKVQEYSSLIASKIPDDLVECKKFFGNGVKPVLKLVPAGKLGKKTSVHVHVVGRKTKEKLQKFLPKRNNVKTSWLFGEKNDDDVPTPYYNSLVLHDLTMPHANALHAEKINSFPSIRDGIILLKIWLAQRQLGTAFDGFNSHVMTSYVVYLLQTKKLNTCMSSYQIVRHVWSCLANSNWVESGFSLCEGDNMQDRISMYRKHYDCVFLDITGCHNITAHISEDTFKNVQSMAKDSLHGLDDANFTTFSILFMGKVPFYRSFDYLLCIHDPKALESINKASSRTDKVNLGIDKFAQSVKTVVSLLKQGLGRRISSISIMPRQSREWEISDEIPSTAEKIYVGLNLDPEFAFNHIEKGPVANLPEAKDFVKFWGGKTDLRRFQDGTTCETLVWGHGLTLFNKRLICRKIVNFLLYRNLKLLKEQYFIVSNELEEYLQSHKLEFKDFAYGTMGEEAALNAIKAFSDLEKVLTNLTELPLSINGVQGLSPVFHYTEVFPSLPTSQVPNEALVKVENCLLLNPEMERVTTYVAPLEAAIQLSSSGKWPSDLEAIRMTKAAFNIQIAQCLKKQRGIQTQSNWESVTAYKDGYVFKLYIAHQKEIALMKKVVEDGVIKYVDTEESLELEKKLFHLPKLNSALHGLYSQQPSFGPACCLAKRWLSSHMIDDSHMPSIVVDLIMASIYLKPLPYKPPQMPQVAFLRFLDICMENHWHLEPVMVNFNDEISREDIVAIENEVTTSRESLPPLVILTPYDNKSTIWTRKAPSAMILTRVSTLAKEALQVVESQIVTSSSPNFAGIFKTPLSDYDVLIHLKNDFNPRRLQAIDLETKHPKVAHQSYGKNAENIIPVAGFDPVQSYLKELRENYNELALFFHDTFGGSVIGVLFHPTALEDNEFSLRNVGGTKINQQDRLVLNVNAVLNDFYLIGRNIVDNIHIQSKRCVMD